MRKIALALALIASLQIAGAQGKSVSAAKSAYEAAKAAAENPKKAAKFATWMKLGQALMDANDAPAGNGWVNASRQDLALVMGNTKPSASENVEIGGKLMTKDIYDACEYYFDGDRLAMINITKPVVEDALGKALEAYKKAYELDVKGAKTKDITAAIKNIGQKYVEQAYNQYSFGDFKKSSELFEAAANASLTKPCDVVDTTSIFNTGLTSWIAGDFDKAKSYFTTCLDKYGYEGNEGEIYAKLADICEKTNDKAGTKDILERGFAKYPQSQSILIGLINYYISSNEDPARLFDLIGEAKRNEPENASLYYVEGNINKELGKIDDAIASYRKCAEINPNYEFGYIGEGILFYNRAIEVQDLASKEMDDAKWEVLAKEFETCLKNCITPFEKGFEITKDDALKVNIAEYLKNACYRFQSEDDNYKAAYEKYSQIVANGTAK